MAAIFRLVKYDNLPRLLQHMTTWLIPLRFMTTYEIR